MKDCQKRELQDKKEALEVTVWSLEKDHTSKVPLGLPSVDRLEEEEKEENEHLQAQHLQAHSKIMQKMKW